MSAWLNCNPNKQHRWVVWMHSRRHAVSGQITEGNMCANLCRRSQWREHMFLFWVVKHLRFRKYDSSKQIETCTNPIVMFILFKSQCRLLFLQKSFLSRVLQSSMVARQHSFAALSSTKFLNRRFVSATRNELPFQTLKLDFPCRLLSAATDPKASIKTNQNKSNTKITHSERINKLKVSTK